MELAKDDPAPAIGRGLALLKHLDAGGPCTLDELATATQWPKSSILRCLTSLELAEAVGRDTTTKRYRPLLRLMPVEAHADSLRDRWATVADKLASDTHQTIELHEFDGEALTMIDRREPNDAVVSVRARIGFKRDLAEIDSLTQVVLAFGLSRSRWPRRRKWVWSSGHRRTLYREAINHVVQRVTQERIATDLGINENGVRRYAAPILDCDLRLRAVLAIAQVCGPNAVQPSEAIQAAVCRAAKQISKKTTTKP